MSRKIIIILLVLLAITSIVWIPAIVFAFQGQAEKFDYYVKALEYMYRGFVIYLQKVIELFKVAVGL